MVVTDHNSVAADILLEVKRFLASRGPSTDYSLFSGDAGIALFLGNQSLTSGDQDAERLAISLLENALGSIASKDGVVFHGMMNGFAGVGWVLQYFINKGILDDADADALGPIDDYVERLLVQRKDYRDCSYSYGLTGLGVYYIERYLCDDLKSAYFLRLILDRIKDIAVRDEHGVAWADTVQELRRPGGAFFNLGLAHGSAGILSFLVSLQSLKIDTTGTAVSLAEEAASWIINKRHPSPQYSQYPSMSQKIRVLGDRSRLGWCNGDLSVAVALAKLYQVTAKSEYTDHATELAIFSSRRTPENGLLKIDGTPPQIDPTFCHGTSGIAYILGKLASQTGAPELQESSQKWWELTFAMADKSEGRSGRFNCYYHYKEGAPEVYWENSFSLFRGSSGIGIMLSSLDSTGDSSWERAVLLNTI
jgi:lantibiotic modifying enzyme